MNTGETESQADDGAVAEAEVATEEVKAKLDLEVVITDVGPCKKHLKIAVARTDIDKQFEETFGTMKKEAAVPGFRPGRAPRQLVEKMFKKQVAGQVKTDLLMAALGQIDLDYKIKPITAPNLDIDAIELPEHGPMRFEIDVEVQPDFPLPAYKNLVVHRPVKTISEADIDAQVRLFLERSALMVPKLEGGAEINDYVTADLAFSRNGIALNEAKEVKFRLQPDLRFQDGIVRDFGSVVAGAKPGEQRVAQAEIGSSSPDPALRGQEVQVDITILDLKQLRLPDPTPAYFASTGFEDMDDLRDEVKTTLEKRLAYQQKQAIRKEILDKLIVEIPFDLPTNLVARQEQSTLRRLVSEMRQGGLGDMDIRAREAEIRANAHESTTRSLKEYFLLSKIADAEEIKVEEEDLEEQIRVLAARTDESPRRVRARIEKEGLGEALASQILEEKTIERILQYISVEDVPMEEQRAVETLDQAAFAAPEIADPAAIDAAEAAEAAEAAGAPKATPSE